MGEISAMAIGQGVISRPVCTAVKCSAPCSRKGSETSASIWPEKEQIDVAIENANSGDAHEVDRQHGRDRQMLAADQQIADHDRSHELRGEQRDAAAMPQRVDAGDQKTEHQRREDRAQDVEAMRRARRVGQGADANDEGGDAERHIDGEQPWPWRDRQNAAGNGWSDCRRDRDDRRVKRETAAQDLVREDEADQRRVHAHDAGSTKALHYARGGEQRQGMGPARKAATQW